MRGFLLSLISALCLLCFGCNESSDTRMSPIVGPVNPPLNDTTVSLSASELVGRWDWVLFTPAAPWDSVHTPATDHRTLHWDFSADSMCAVYVNDSLISTEPYALNGELLSMDDSYTGRALVYLIDRVAPAKDTIRVTLYGAHDAGFTTYVRWQSK